MRVSAQSRGLRPSEVVACGGVFRGRATLTTSRNGSLQARSGRACELLPAVGLERLVRTSAGLSHMAWTRECAAIRQEARGSDPAACCATARRRAGSRPAEMQLDRLTIRNFRNFDEIDIPLSPGTVIVGENRAGKSNLVHALWLVLDASLPNSDRQLRAEDFWDGLAEGEPDWDPMADSEVIEVAVEMSGFDGDPVLLPSWATPKCGNPGAVGPRRRAGHHERSYPIARRLLSISRCAPPRKLF